MTDQVSLSTDQSLKPSYSQRIVSLDLFRGLVMALMTLDHVRIFFSNAKLDPLDITQSNLALFFTRWVTHICPPSFIFLAGIGAYLSLQRGKSKQQLSHFLINRGIWLVFLELTVIQFGWFFNLTYKLSFMGVLWAIGWSMVILAGLIYLPNRAIATFAIILIFGHNLFDWVEADKLGNLSFLWSVLHQTKSFEIFPGYRFIIAYPLIPWIGVMALGYVFGTVFTWEKKRRCKLFKELGLSLLIAFLVLRTLNIYGDPKPWSIQSNVVKTFLSFLNCHKYPPSLLYLLMTLSVALLLLCFFENKKLFRFLQPLAIFGRVPLFFYIVHFWLIHLTAILFAVTEYGYQAFSLTYIPKIMRPENYGYDLTMVYNVWILILIILYPICLWFGKYKKTHKSAWLKYL